VVVPSRLNGWSTTMGKTPGIEANFAWWGGNPSRIVAVRILLLVDDRLVFYLVSSNVNAFAFKMLNMYDGLQLSSLAIVVILYCA
jgi:hypothetical protein